MKLEAVDSKETLEAVATAFVNFRSSKGTATCNYPDSLKLRAVNLVRQGITSVSVARACGLGTTTLFYWLKAHSAKPIARKVEIVAEPSVTNSQNECTFRTNCGVILETNKETAAWLLQKLSRGALC